MLRFGSLLAGVLVFVSSTTIGGAACFALGKQFLSRRIEEFKWGEQPPIKNAGWYQTIQSAVQKDPFKIALLLRLAPILPIPVSGHWYLCGALRMKFTL